jgi:hypothetical protein
MNLSLYSVNAFLILDSEGQRVLAKYYRPHNHPLGEAKGLLTLKEQRAFEKGLWQKTKKSGGSDHPFFLLRCSCLTPRMHPRLGRSGDIILYDSHLAVYKHTLDLILYFIAGPTENELMLSSALQSLSDAMGMLLRNQLEKRGVLENLDLVVLCLDETIDDGCVFSLLSSDCSLTVCSIIVDTDATAIASRVSRPRADTTEIVLNEQTLVNAYNTVKEKMQQRMAQY